MRQGDLSRAVSAAKQILKSLSEKYENEFREAKPRLVFSSRLGQVEIDAPFEKQITEFPEMFLDNAQKDSALELVNKIKKAKRSGGIENQKSLNSQLAMLKDDVSYLESVYIGMRFDTLVFELIWALQKDCLVDRDLTPQTRASIRIVIGTIANLSKVP